MESMNVPGFTACMSLYPTAGHYRAFIVAPAHSESVEPRAINLGRYTDPTGAHAFDDEGGKRMADFMQSLFDGPGVSWGGSSGWGADGGTSTDDQDTNCMQCRTDYQMDLAKCKASAEAGKNYPDCEPRADKDLRTCQKSYKCL